MTPAERRIHWHGIIEKQTTSGGMRWVYMTVTQKNPLMFSSDFQ